MSADESKEVPLQAAQQAAYELATDPVPSHPEIGRLFRENHEKVFRAAFRVLGNATDAEDVLQTVFLRLLRREGGEPLSEDLGSYLHRAAVNGALDLLRARGRARTTPLEDVEPVLADRRGGGPGSAPAGRELRDRLRDALGRLSPKAAEIFTLRYLEGYENREIARMLGAGRTTVAVTLHRARRKLQEELRPLVEAGRGGIEAEDGGRP